VVISIYPLSHRMPAVQIPAQGTFPHRFGPYVLLQPLGKGGMGQVSLAITGARGMETLCVVKRILPRLRAEPELVGRFRDEAELSRRLSHPNLVQTQAVGQIDGEPFIAQEFVEGHDLSEVCRRCSIDQLSLPVEIVVHIVREIARGLAYAHDFEGLQLVHRDINPVNVRLTYTGDVKLLDFGLATSRAKTFFTEPGTNWGKRAFMAPEQLASGPIDRRADLYVLGILLWESLTERQLWTTIKDGQEVAPEGNHAAAIERMLNADIAPPSAFNGQISPALDRVVLKALARSPAERFQSAGELRAALGPFLPSTGDVDVELGRLLTGLFDVEKERAERRAVVAAGQALMEDAASPEADHLHPHGAKDAPAASVSADPPSRLLIEAPDLVVAPFNADHDFHPDLPEPGFPAPTPTAVMRRRGRRLLVATAAATLVAGVVVIMLAGRNRGRHDRRSRAAASGSASALAARTPGPAPTPAAAAAPAATTTARVEVAPPRAVTPKEPPAEGGVGAGAGVAARPVGRREPPAAAPVRVARRSAVKKGTAGPAAPLQPRIDSTQLISDASNAFRDRRFDEALRLARLAAIAGAGAPAHVVLGNTYLAMSRLAEAEREYSKALLLAPDDASTKERLAITREMRKRESSPQPEGAPTATTP
jgi:serine/threonine protein kinase